MQLLAYCPYHHPGRTIEPPEVDIPTRRSIPLLHLLPTANFAGLLISGEDRWVINAIPIGSDGESYYTAHIAMSLLAPVRLRSFRSYHPGLGSPFAPIGNISFTHCQRRVYVTAPADVHGRRQPVHIKGVFRGEKGTSSAALLYHHRGLCRCQRLLLRKIWLHQILRRICL